MTIGKIGTSPSILGWKLPEITQLKARSVLFHQGISFDTSPFLLHLLKDYSLHNAVVQLEGMGGGWETFLLWRQKPSDLIFCALLVLDHVALFCPDLNLRMLDLRQIQWSMIYLSYVYHVELAGTDFSFTIEGKIEGHPNF